MDNRVIKAAALTLIATSFTVHAALTETEAIYMKVPSAESARDSLRFITSKPHIAGTPGDFEMALYVRDKMLAAGIPKAEIQPVDVLLSYPVDRSLRLKDKITGEVLFEAPLEEKIIAEDPTTDTWWRNHTFNGYSPSGSVEAPAVYANYARPEDLDELERMGVSIEGMVVIARYGKCFRGLKAMNVQRRGGVGLIIYSDPEEDGFRKGATYPDGGWRPRSGVQRGSVVFNSLCAGDPARAAAGSESVETLCGYTQRELTPSIPVLAVSWGDAEPLLRALGGQVAPAGFQGGLNMVYMVGSSTSSVSVQLHVENEEHVGPIWNVIAEVPGTLSWSSVKGGGEGDQDQGQDRDRPVVLGNHRDAWVFGAVDPNSGTAALLEVARGLGKLVKGGWQPPRTIVLCSWSGEELGMLGSTAWGEANAKGILAKAIAYLNVDEAVSGPKLKVIATPSLGTLIRHTLSDVEDPNTGQTMAEVWTGELKVLGSGSDYAVFLDHLGIASIDFGLKADLDDDYGTYHSIYDSFTWMEMHGDPGFAYHRAAAQLWGLLALRLADPHPTTGLPWGHGDTLAGHAAVLPFDPVAQAEALEGYVRALEDLRVRHSSVVTGAGQGWVQGLGGKEGAGASSAVVVAPDELGLLRVAVAAFRSAAEGVAVEVEAITRMGEEGGGLRGGRVMAASAAAVVEGGGAGGGLERLEDLNDRLSMVERRFLTEDGLPKRKWFKHVVQAPGLYLGYDAETFPGITQPLKDGDRALAREQIAVAASCVLAAANYLGGDTASAHPAPVGKDGWGTSSPEGKLLTG